MASKSIMGKTRWGNPIWPLRGALGPSPCNGGGLRAPFSLAAGVLAGRATRGREQGCEHATVLEHCRAGGLNARLMWCVEPGVRLFAVIRLSTGLLLRAPAPCVALRGVACGPQPDG
jgi:hypothetical protein